MKAATLTIILLVSITSLKCQNTNDMNYNTLTSDETKVIINKGTEMPYTGEFYQYSEEGIYTCKQCDTELYNSSNKFDAHCGWPSFDDEIDGAVKRIPDKDEMRTEIVCTNCGGHLGHVFLGEGFTDKNTRHCVNSISMNFVSTHDPIVNNAYESAIFAAGCFWGVEHHMQIPKGVISTDVGYIGGSTENPTYNDVCYTNSGHAEAIKVVFNPSIISFEKLTKLFFEIHDPGQLNRQGPDVGAQYRSEIFYFNEEQKKTSEKLIGILESKGHTVVTRLTPASDFYPAEEYHQDYYKIKGSNPYCHFYKKKF